MSEFVELGGYIVSGETLVYPDNTTMTGNGTVDSPLGVVPGYNETVLWSGNGAVSAVLSEPMTNFKRLKIRLGNQGGTDGGQYVEVPAVPSAIKNLTYNAGGGSNFYFIGLYCSADENSITIKKEASFLKAFGSTSYAGQAENTAYKPALHEVIGINRKENV